MNINEVYQLMDKFEASTLNELTLEMEGVKLSVKKGGPCGAFPPPQGMPAPVMPGVAPENTPVQPTTTSTTKTINAPLVGTFYHAAGPEEKPFVEVGQQVKKGDVIGIIEAMKLMNEITATEDGVVEEIVVGDGNLVEYNEVLIRLS